MSIRYMQRTPPDFQDKSTLYAADTVTLHIASRPHLYIYQSYSPRDMDSHTRPAFRPLVELR